MNLSINSKICFIRMVTCLAPLLFLFLSNTMITDVGAWSLWGKSNKNQLGSSSARKQAKKLQYE